MVAPLIVGAARVTRQKGATGKKSSPSTANVRTYKTGARITPRAANDNNYSHKESANDNPAAQQQSRAKIPLRPRVTQIAATLANEETTQLLQRARALRAGWIIIATTSVFWPIQLFFWALSVGFFGLAITPGINILEHVPLLNAATSWSRWFSLSQLLLIGTVGIPSMIYAAFIFTASQVPCFSTSKILIFIFCLAGYCIVFINIVPWVVIWALSVMFLQEKNNPPKEG